MSHSNIVSLGNALCFPKKSTKHNHNVKKSRMNVSFAVSGRSETFIKSFTHVSCAERILNDSNVLLIYEILLKLSLYVLPPLG